MKHPLEKLKDKLHDHVHREVEKVYGRDARYQQQKPELLKQLDQRISDVITDVLGPVVQ